MSTPIITRLPTEQSATQRVLILGGGFGGLYAALELDKQLRNVPGLEVTLVNRENFFLFTPMLHEVAASDLDVTHIVNPVRKMLRHVRFFAGDVESIDLSEKRVVVRHGFTGHTHELTYDHLVLALGSVTNFYGIPGLAEGALTMKTLGDAIHLRNRLVAHLEEADSECCANPEPLLTFVVAGGGFAGVETIAGINDFLREVLDHYPRLRPEMLRLLLVHSGPVILPELSEKLGRYAQQKLAARGVEIRVETKVSGFGPEGVRLSDGNLVPASTLIWTAGTAAHPILAMLPCVKERGRILTDETLQVPGYPGLWALGDSALVPDPRTGSPQPPTAQHALREGRVVAQNILASLRGRRRRPFRFSTLGQLAAIGRRTGVAQILGRNFSGFFAWWLWRTIYLSKLPRAEKKLRVVLDWTLDLFFSKDFVQFETLRARAISTEPKEAAPITRIEAKRTQPQAATSSS